MSASKLLRQSMQNLSVSELYLHRGLLVTHLVTSVGRSEGKTAAARTTTCATRTPI
jgi:hypothetical protein